MFRSNPMFRLLSLFKLPEEKLILGGIDCSGKTTFLYRLKLGEVVTTIPTIGFNVERIEYKDRAYNIWDVDGRPGIRPLMRHYLEPNCVMLFLHNCTEGEERTQESLAALRLHVEQMEMAGARFLFVVMNKQDLLPPECRKKTVDLLQKRFQQLLSGLDTSVTCRVLDVPDFSSITGWGLYEALSEISDTFANNKEEKRKVRRVKPSSSKTSEVYDVKYSPAYEHLIRQIYNQGYMENDADSFSASLRTAHFTSWDHRAFLRTVFFCFCDLGPRKSLLGCASDLELFMERLIKCSPDLQIGEVSRSKIVFWMYHLKLAIIHWRRVVESWQVPRREDFQAILLQAPWLMNENLLVHYYSTSHIDSSTSSAYWQLPDLAVLTDPRGNDISQITHKIFSNTKDRPERQIEFAFEVVKFYLLSHHRRGWVVSRALASYQSVLMRCRLTNPSVPTYSETQLYFWIQLAHAALALRNHSELEDMTYEEFRPLYNMKPSDRSAYYSTETWESIAARSAFVAPDKSPIPNVFLPRPVEADSKPVIKQSMEANQLMATMAPELPSQEVLHFHASIMIGEITAQASGQLDPHTSLMRELIAGASSLAADEPSDEDDWERSKRRWLSENLEGIPLTHKAFWLDQIIPALPPIIKEVEIIEYHKCECHKGQELVHQTPVSYSIPPRPKPPTAEALFDKVISRNPQLAWQKLPLVYYSREVWESKQAVYEYLAPDKRGFGKYQTASDPFTVGDDDDEEEDADDKAKDHADFDDDHADAVTLVDKERQGEEWVMLEEEENTQA